MRRAIAGEASLETLVCRQLYSRDPHHSDPPWGAVETAAWARAVAMWREARSDTIERRRAGYVNRPVRHQPDLNAIWSEILYEAQLFDNKWDVGSHLKWDRIVGHLGLTKQTAARLLDAQGWVFTGQGKNRRCVAAPCSKCGMRSSPSALLNGVCKSCR